MSAASSEAHDRLWRLRRQLRPAAWYVLCELVDRGDRPVALTSGELATSVGLGRDAVRAALRELEDAGVIERTTVRGERGRFGSGTYVVCPAPENSAPATAPSRPRTRSQPTALDQADQLSLLGDNSASA